MALLAERAAARRLRAPRATSLTSALEFQEVSKRYGRDGPLALDRITLAVGGGARTCLLGPNGAGKSTTIRLALGALQPTSGRVRMLGADVNGPDYLDARRRTGVVPQGPGMYPDLSVLEYLKLARALYQRGDIGHVIEVLGLGPHRNKMLAQLSGGYQRRAVMAAALLPDPDLILLDEPTVGLDPIATHEVHEALREVMAGRTMLLCTHNLFEAEALCDEVIILLHGRVHVHAPLTELRQRAIPRLYLAARQGAAALEAALARRGLSAAPDDAAEGGDGLLVDIADPERDAPDLLRALLAEGLDVYECRPTRATLQTLFLDIVRPRMAAPRSG
jgi:ABC-2 type transport system ATP-binding protein